MEWPYGSRWRRWTYCGSEWRRWTYCGSSQLRQSQLRQPWRQLSQWRRRHQRHCRRELGRDIATKSRGSATRAEDEKLENASAMASEQRLASHHSDYVSWPSKDRYRRKNGRQKVPGIWKSNTSGFKGLWKTVKQCVFQQPISKSKLWKHGKITAGEKTCDIFRTWHNHVVK